MLRLCRAWLVGGVLMAAACSFTGDLDELKGGGGKDGGGGAATGGVPGDGGGVGGAAGDAGGTGGGAQCPPGKKACGADCVSIDEPATGCARSGCAACGLAHASSICVGGECVIAQCAAGFEDCNGSSADGCEANLKTDATHCGACGKSCALPNAKVSCAGGACQFDGCEPGYADCNKDPKDGCEVNTQADPSNCGGCGSACPVPTGKSATCTLGVCGISSCAAPLADCDQDPGGNCETNLSSSVSHCGFCGNACSFANASASCASGTCALGTCNAGFGNCDDNPANGCELQTSSSVTNCGACGNACPGGANASPECVGGACGLKCGAGWANCDGSAANGCEVNLTTSTAHCGACGKACSSANGTPSCSGGGCSIACSSGWASCDGNVANGCETSLSTDQNCKACGAVVGASGSAGNNNPYVLRKVTASGNKLTFQSCYYDYDYGDTCTPQVVTLSGLTASGSAGNNYPYVLRKVTASGNKLTFQSCYYDYDYGDTCTPGVITLACGP